MRHEPRPLFQPVETGEPVNAMEALIRREHAGQSVWRSTITTWNAAIALYDAATGNPVAEAVVLEHYPDHDGSCVSCWRTAGCGCCMSEDLSWPCRTTQRVAEALNHDLES